MIKTNRSLLTYIVLNCLTCGIYGFYFTYSIARDVNQMCAGDGRWWWQYQLGNRLADNAPRYGLHFSENGTTVILWDVVGLLLCFLGPFFAMHILIKNTNALASAYNSRGNGGGQVYGTPTVNVNVH